MNQEIRPIGQLPTDQLIQQRDKTLEYIEKRNFHIAQIGYCKTKDGSSFENSLELGIRRADAKGRLARDQEKLNDINQELAGYEKAKQHLNKIELRKKQLTQMSQMVTQGNLSQEIFQQHQNEYQELVLLSETDPDLARGITRIRQEEERKAVSVSQESKSTKDYKLSPKQAQLFEKLNGSSLDNLVTSEQITNALWENVDNNSARKCLHALVKATNERLSNFELKIVVISNHSDRRNGERAYYYLKTTNQPDQVPESTQPTEIPKSPKDIVADETLQTKEDEEIASINKPEYGTLSRADISMIASAINRCRYFLEPILKEYNTRLIEAPITTELENLIGDTPFANFIGMTRQQIDAYSIQFRIQALQKVKDLIESPQVDKILDEIYTKNSEVWSLLLNLSEMNDKLRGEAKNGDNYYHTKQGITFLTDLVTNHEKTRLIYYVTDDQGNKSERCINCGIDVPDIICSSKD